MSAFEDKIKRNKEYFDHREPDPGHIERFTARLDENLPARKNKLTSFLVLKVAAALLILVSVSYTAIYFMMGSQARGTTNVHLIKYDENFNEILAYYDAVSVERIEEIDRMVRNEEEALKLKQSVENRMENLDISMAAIEKEYLKNPENKSLQAALINNKRKKVEVMDHIISQLDFANTELY